MKGTTGGAAFRAAIAAALVVFGAVFLPRLRSDSDDATPSVRGGEAVLIGWDVGANPSPARCHRFGWNQSYGKGGSPLKRRFRS